MKHKIVAIQTMSVKGGDADGPENIIGLIPHQRERAGKKRETERESRCGVYIIDARQGTVATADAASRPMRESAPAEIRNLAWG